MGGGATGMKAASGGNAVCVPLARGGGRKREPWGCVSLVAGEKSGNRAALLGGDLVRGFARMLRMMYLCAEFNITRYEIETNGCDAGASLSVDGRKGTRGAEADCGNLYGRNEQGDLFLSVR